MRLYPTCVKTVPLNSILLGWQDKVEMSLDGKTALVVGFAGAIGSSIDTSLADAGCDIIGVDKAKQDSVHISIDKIKESRLIFFSL